MCPNLNLPLTASSHREEFKEKLEEQKHIPDVTYCVLCICPNLELGTESLMGKEQHSNCLLSGLLSSNSIAIDDLMD